MSTTKCPACKGKVSINAESCPKCGHPFDDEWRGRMTKKKTSSSRNAILMFLLLAGAWWYVDPDWSEETSGDSTPEATHEQKCGYDVEAFSYAQILISQQLTNPDSADFSMVNAKMEMLSCGRWVVSSYFDAQNSFGGTVRTNFVATVMKNPNGNWTMENLETF